MYAATRRHMQELSKFIHLDPLAEGERRTRMEDVIPLCANCHIMAHTRKPPIPIEELREIIRETD